MNPPDPTLRRIPVYATEEHECAYIPKRRARTLFVDPEATLSPLTYDRLIEQGFRRSGEYIYQPRCPGCSACQSLRLPVAAFTPSRRHRRCIKRNETLTVRIVPAEFRQEHFELYRRYLAARHPDSPMEDMGPDQYHEFVTSSWCTTVFYEFRDDERLLAVSVVDELPSCLSAVYTFFDPDEAPRSLGTLSILWLIQAARAAARPYVYLGYWIEESPAMRYKSEFRPHEIFTSRGWERVE